MWNFYCCDGLQSCCDVDHLAMHIFFLGLAGSIILLISGTTSVDATNNKRPPYQVYFVGIGWGIAVTVWGFYQIGRVLRRRQDAAISLDQNTKLRVQKGNLDENIQTAVDIEAKLRATHQVTLETTVALKRKFNDLKRWVNDSKVISDQNTRIGLLLYDKMKKLYDDLQEQLIASEKEVILSIYNELHLKDGQVGLTEDEFKIFVNKLPDGYRKRFAFEVGAFEQYAGNDGIFDRTELFIFLDKFVAEEAVKEETVEENQPNNNNTQ